jgi:hypothetical protein
MPVAVSAVQNTLCHWQKARNSKMLLRSGCQFTYSLLML